MRKSTILVATAMLGIVGAAQAGLTVDVDSTTDGVDQSWSFFYGTHEAFQTIEWELIHEAFAPSFASEVRITLLHVDSGVEIVMGGGADPIVDINFLFPDAPGVYGTAGLRTAPQVNANIPDAHGEWWITIDETYDDGIDPDGHIAGMIMINGGGVPTPSALALLSVATVMGGRRRRRR